MCRKAPTAALIYSSREELLFAVERDHRRRIRQRRCFKGKDQKRSLPLYTQRAARVRTVACRLTPSFVSLCERVRFFLGSKAVGRSIDSVETAFRRRKSTILAVSHSVISRRFKGRKRSYRFAGDQVPKSISHALVRPPFQTCWNSHRWECSSA